MPTYTLKSKKTGEVRDDFMSISEMEALVAEGEWEVDLTGGGTYAVLDPMRMGRYKRDPDFHEKLRFIKKSHLGSRMEVD